MASRIKGITVEIGGDTSGLEKSLSDVNNSIKKTQSQLRDVNNLLKLDPSNTILLAQKQELLQSAIGDTEKKLQALEQVQADVAKAFERGDLGKDQYMAFQREVEETRGALNRYQADLSGLQSEQERLAANTERLNKLFAATGSSVDDYADVLGSRLVTAIRNGTVSSDQLKTAVEKIGKAVTGGKADIKQLTDALDTVDDGQAVRNLINDLNDVGDAAQGAADDIGEIAKATKGTALMEAADQMSVVGDKIQDVGDQAVSAYAETETAVSKVNAYFGETGEAAEASAEIVKNVYGSGVGQSMDAVAEAVIMVKKNLGDLGDTDLTNLTKQALTLEELYGIDMNETLRGVNSLMKQYGLTAQEAMDYIVRGTQNGLDKTNELGDNLSEYAGKFEQAGYSASEYFQLLQNGLQGGAYNLDKVNDAINEVTTRLADGTIGDSIDLYSQKTQSLFLAWQNGEATQKQVIDSIVADIGSCTSQQEALNMAAQAFGTMAEDGNLKFITSLTSVGETYDSVAGSAQNLFSQTQTPMQEMEANTRKLQQALVPLGEKIVELANMVLPPLVAIITAVSEVFGMLPEPVQNFVIILGALLVAFTALTPVIAALAVSFGALNISLLPVIGIIAGVAAAIAGIIAIVKNWGAITEWFGNLWQTVSRKLMELWNGVVVFFTETIPAAFQIFIGFFSAIPNWWSGLWSQVFAFFTNTWNAILQNPIVQLVVTTITSLWEHAKKNLQGIWSGICDIAVGAWELLKNVILAPVLLLIDLVTGNFSKLASDAANIWNNIRNAASQIWSGIRQVVTSVASGLKQGVETVFSALSQFASQIWSAMKQTASSVWNGIKTTVVNIASTLREAAVSAFQRMVSGIGSALSGLYSVVSNGFSSAIRFITGLPGQAFQWGKDFIQGLINGISSMIQSVINTVSGLADRIRSFLHFSAPDEGPLADYETWMPDFMKGLAGGIEKNRNLVEKAVRDVASDMVVSPKVNGMEYGYADGAFSGGSMSDLISGISSAVSEALAGFSGPQGNIVIPVYVGGTLLDELVVTAQARQNLRSGGR
ncbi:phage tail tape measure protein [Mediterraneibacter glycyrrhizinilyticus]|uniref:phage tail tape measure protein n=1 Tax=Mediterraneibacter glycyrrhizinilyticus TaxID=342942 RepID=UPI0025A373D1|nr:phage tail tape measure protein [Mediterraneibacter glycyrrhizinilyticus]MDM8210015.1 phage tail tape measure protein [Mediterraneibacter glycyrrhizinilyticus]